MPLRWMVRPNTYHDSVKLMRVSEALAREPGVERAAVVMATRLNIDLLGADGLLPEEVHAGAEDLLISVLADGEEQAEQALARMDALLTPAARSAEIARAPARTLEDAAARAGANLAVIAVPGPYAAAEAYAALHAGLHVFLFSDNVPVEDEVHLKALAAERDLLMMGPDCGTAILGGVGLGFANRVASGPVGIVGASGTGIQQVVALLDAAGIGIAAAVGTGGRDLSAQVGGSMTLRAVHMLERDPAIEILCVIAKPGDSHVARRLHLALASFSKPVVACLLGESLQSEGAVAYVGTLSEAADGVARRLGVDPPVPRQRASRVYPPNTGETVYGPFAGGTLCNEAARALGSRGVRAHLLDLGDDEYTRGRAHPIIDPRLRNTMLVDLASRNDLGAVLIDVILGDLAHPDPAGALAPAIDELRRRGRDVPIVAVLIGTRADPQDIQGQQAILENLGVTVCDRVSAAADLAAMMVGSAAV